jgi:cytochrome bd-type quinol oxidase subunit 2
MNRACKRSMALSFAKEIPTMNLRRSLTSRISIAVILILQIVALLLFPSDSFASTTQEWWLPMLLVVMVLIADVELILRQSFKSWPWALISFAHGFNIISRLMLVWPHATIPSDGATLFNAPYVVYTVISILMSGLVLAYMEWPEVRSGLLKPIPTK